MTATIQEVMDDAFDIIGEVAGSGTQAFEDDIMRSNVVRGFNMLFKKYAWEQYTGWFRIELDGVNGMPTTDAFEQVKDFEDFIAVHRDAETVPMPILPKTINPFSFTTGDTRVCYWSSMLSTNAHYKKRKLQFWPATGIGFINVQAKVYPLVPPALRLTQVDTLYLDRDLMAYAAAFSALISSDLNANAANVVKGLMDDRYNTIMNALAAHPMNVSGNTGIPNQWREYP